MTDDNFLRNAAYIINKLFEAEEAQADGDDCNVEFVKDKLNEAIKDE